MKPIYYIINNREVIGKVYQKENNKVIFIQKPIDLEYGLIFMKPDSEIIKDDVVSDILKDFLIR
jgi:hypothetical protein